MPEFVIPGQFSSNLPQPNSIEGVPTAITAFVGYFRTGPTNRAVLIENFRAFEKEFGGLDEASEASYGVWQFFMNGGKSTWIVRVSDSTDSPMDAALIIGDQAKRTGIFALEDVDQFNLLCIPGSLSIRGSKGASWQEAQPVFEGAEAYCEQRRAFFIMDGPDGIDDPKNVEIWLATHSSIRHRNAAFFYPRLMIPDPLNNQRPRRVGASGTIAGLIARTDSARGVWKAPAGTEAILTNVLSIQPALTDQEAGHLNALAVNCIRELPQIGIVNWGARTLVGRSQAGDEWRYIPVRRLALYIEESILRGTQGAVFEPNDEPLWARIRSAVEDFMHALWLKGALPSPTSDEAFFVKCGLETTTPADIQQGFVNILVGFAPLKPAEFIILKIRQRAGQAVS
jgi:phage tail sheath protein FI